tara:strand:- start:2883 stop:4121 length:1239 start_codon:yes stop_codon:yes gene_type:complete
MNHLHLEECLIGTLLNHIEYRDLIFDITDKDHFPNRYPIYLEACRQHGEGMRFDAETISANVKDYPYTQILEMQMYGVPSEEKIKSYVFALKEQRDRRLLKDSIAKTYHYSQKEDITTDDLLLHISKLSEDTEETGDAGALTPIEIFERESNNPIKQKLSTNVGIIDQKLYKDVGLHKGDINVILADSGHGKTQFSLFLASQLLNSGHVGLWFQMEDYDVNTAKHLALNSMDHCDKMFIVDDKDDIDDIKRVCKLVKQEHGLDFVVIDYIQEVYAKGRFDSRTLELNYVTKVLKQIAKEINVVVIVPSQVTINDHIRNGWQLEPRYKDAQWAQVIKNVAHCMTSVFRPSMVQSLVVNDGLTQKVSGWHEDQRFNYNSVFVKLVKSRRGVISHERIQLNHNGDKGLEIAKRTF